jgi:transcriptional regulator with XRE-family HTH domain
MTDAVSDTTIGDRLAVIRRRQALTQEQLAEAADVSVETIRKLERNERTAARVATLNRLARALNVRTSALFGTSGRAVGSGEVDEDAVSLMPLRRVLAPARGIRGGVVTAVDGEPPSLDLVREAISAVDRAYHNDDYASAVTALPVLLIDAGMSVDAADGDDLRRQALRVQSEALQVAGTMLIQTRTFDLAHRALDQALDAADAADDDVVGAAAVVSLCWLLLREGRLDEAEALAVTTADSIEPSFSRVIPEHITVWGWLMLRGAAAASRNNRDDRAREMLDAASAAAVRIANMQGLTPAPGPVSGWAFGPRTVAMKRVEGAVVAGDTAMALSLAGQVPPGGKPTSNNLNRHLLDVAYANLDQHQFSEATTIMYQVQRNAPSWLRHQRFAHDIVAELVASRRRAISSDLASLADAVGLHL